MGLALSALSTEYIRVPVAGTKNGTAINPTSDVIQFAFPVAGAAPISGDWKTGSWETVVDNLNVTHFYARCLIGPGGGAVIALTAGRYDIWIKIFDNPETPAINCGQLLIQ